ncbi:hypothetical protein SVAN01_03216 [Stagonosporopsis vannaccii]|nr:hypothetical protein SVAN01_03216 [Stagonosporopsis vannaccii]
MWSYVHSITLQSDSRSWIAGAKVNAKVHVTARRDLKNCDRKDDLIAIYNAESAADYDSNTTSAGPQQNHIDWRSLYKKISNALTCLKQSTNALVEYRDVIEREIPSWKTEAEGLKEQFAHRSARLDEQAEINEKELLRAAQDCCYKLKYITKWANRGVLVQYRRLERAQINLSEEAYLL